LIYREALDYISNIERAGSDYGIERMRVLLSLLGDPDGRLKFVHVAGTNGKGSVCAYLTSVLKEAGYRVGTYNSPSVFCYNERWRVDGEPLSDGCVARYLTAVREAIDAQNARRERRGFGANPLIDGKLCPTAFEIETAVAMVAFADLGCDIVVLETGLGGRWDATNVIRENEVAVITPIGLDHCGLLGNTLGEIAAEKAAIVKGDGATCAQCEEVMRELRRPYDVRDGKRVYRDINLEVCGQGSYISGGIDGQIFEYGGKKYKISLLGEHQIQNASIAICAIDALRKKGWRISDEALRLGLERAVWHARFEVVQNAQSRFDLHVPHGKTLVFDGAHNPHGANALASALMRYFPEDKIHFVLGILADKDVDGVLDELAPLATRVTAVTPRSPRALGGDELAKMFKARNTACEVCEDIREAVQNALDGDCGVTVLCGSLTLFASLVENR